MAETLNTYRKTVKLPVDSFEAARPLREALDEQVHQAIVSLNTHEPSLQTTRSTDDRGNPSLRASANGYDILITTRSGQDSTFQAGERRTFVSYTLTANSTLRSLDRATTVSREMELFLQIAGAILVAALFFWIIDLLLSLSGLPSIRIPVILIVAIVAGGGWLGQRLGVYCGEQLEARTLSRAERAGALPQLAALWSQLEQRFNSLLTSYESV